MNTEFSSTRATDRIDFTRIEAEARRLRAIAFKAAGRALLAWVRSSIRVALRREPARLLKGANA